jgi:hypothetical protein
MLMNTGSAWAQSRAWTVDELVEMVRSLGERNAGNERHLLTSLRLPAPALSKDELKRVKREARVAGLDCYVDQGWLLLEPDLAALAEQEYFELRDQLQATRDETIAPWLHHLQERGAAWSERLRHLGHQG